MALDPALKQKIESLPVIPVLMAGLGYMGYGYYNFLNDPQSDLNTRKGQVQTAKAEGDKHRAKIKQMVEFKKSLEVRRSKLRNMAAQLDDFKASITEDMDVAEFLKSVTSKARQVGLTVGSLNPGEKRAQEHYYEQSFQLKFRGVFIQFLVFLEQLSQTQRVTRIENFVLRPINSAFSRYVELDGEVDLKAYAYKKSSADDLGREPPASDSSAVNASKGGAASPPPSGKAGGK